MVACWTYMLHAVFLHAAHIRCMPCALHAAHIRRMPCALHAVACRMLCVASDRRCARRVRILRRTSRRPPPNAHARLARRGRVRRAPPRPLAASLPCARARSACGAHGARMHLPLARAQIGIEGDAWLQFAARASQLAITSSLRADWSRTRARVRAHTRASTHTHTHARKEAHAPQALWAGADRARPRPLLERIPPLAPNANAAASPGIVY
jgi:hypothetical protein